MCARGCITVAEYFHVDLTMHASRLVVSHESSFSRSIRRAHKPTFAFASSIFAFAFSSPSLPPPSLPCTSSSFHFTPFLPFPTSTSLSFSLTTRSSLSPSLPPTCILLSLQLAHLHAIVDETITQQVEYFIAEMGDETRQVRLPLRAPEILQSLADFKKKLPSCNCAKEIVWHPEYANWMLEATPGQPYRETMADLLEVESNMVMRRKCIRESSSQRDLGGFGRGGEGVAPLPLPFAMPNPAHIPVMSHSLSQPWSHHNAAAIHTSF